MRWIPQIDGKIIVLVLADLLLPRSICQVLLPFSEAMHGVGCSWWNTMQKLAVDLLSFMYEWQQLDDEGILDSMSLEEDVDGFHLVNTSDIAMQGRDLPFTVCMPKCCVELLIRLCVEIMGKEGLMIGQSYVVGLPIVLLLQVISLFLCI